MTRALSDSPSISNANTGVAGQTVAHAPFWYPAWAELLGAAAWLSTPGLRLAWVNARAEAMLGRPASQLLGRSCAGAIAGRDARGAPFCSAHCPLLFRALRRRPIEPFELRLRDTGPAATRILVIPLTAPDHSRPWLLHCAVSAKGPAPAERFLVRVAARSPGPPVGPTRQRLTVRESEILALLCDDRDLPAIAATLGVSYATIRNHVQHLLRKLGAHSLLEAVARSLV